MYVQTSYRNIVLHDSKRSEFIHKLMQALMSIHMQCYNSVTKEKKEEKKRGTLCSICRCFISSIF